MYSDRYRHTRDRLFGQVANILLVFFKGGLL